MVLLVLLLTVVYNRHQENAREQDPCTYKPFEWFAEHKSNLAARLSALDTVYARKSTDLMIELQSTTTRYEAQLARANNSEKLDLQARQLAVEEKIYEQIDHLARDHSAERRRVCEAAFPRLYPAAQ